MIESLNQYISNIGIEHIPDESIKRKIRVFNWLLFLTTFIDLMLAISWYNFGGIAQMVSCLIPFGVNFLVFLFIKKGYHLLGRNIAFYTAILTVVSVAFFSGRESMTHLILIYFSLSVFLIFDIGKEVKYIRISVVFIFACLILLEFGLFEKATIFDTTYYFYLIHIGLSLVVFRLMVYFVSEMKNFELQLAEKNEELEKNEIELITAKEKAERALLIKSQFLSNMSHEMRTPLNSISGFSDLILEKEEIGNDMEYIEHISRASKSMNNLVNDILDYSKFESDKFTLKPSFITLHGTINEVYNLLKLTSDKKEIKLQTVIELDEGCLFKLDEMRLKQILINLVSNAIRFTEEGVVELHVFLENHGGQSLLNLKVSDTGIGIHENDQSKIFESFTQIETTDNRQYDGTGLGLTIVKKLVDAMSGSINLNSEKNKGTEFLIKIPVECSKKDLSVDSKKAGAPMLNKGLNILVVDDNEMNLLLIEGMFASQSVNVSSVLSGQEALNKMSTEKFDFLLIDLQMPEITGLDVYNMIKSDLSKYSLNKDVSVIILTADAFESTKQKLVNAGIKHILTKPIKKDVLFSVINKECSD